MAECQFDGLDKGVEFSRLYGEDLMHTGNRAIGAKRQSSYVEFVSATSPSACSARQAQTER